MTILLCTAENILLTSLEYRFRKNGWQLQVAHDAQQVRHDIQKCVPDLLVVDLQLPDYQGLDVIQYTKKHLDTDIGILVYGELKEEQLLMEAMRLGAGDFIVTPLKPSELILRIRRLLQRQKVAG